MSFDTDIAEREQPLSAELYSFAFTNGTTLYYTSYERDLLASETWDGNLYTHIPIERTEVPVDDQMASDRVTVSAPVLNLWANMGIQNGQISMRIIKQFLSDKTRQTIFDGLVLNIKKGFGQGVAECATKMYYLEKELPRVFLQSSCNNTLFDRFCTLLASDFTGNFDGTLSLDSKSLAVVFTFDDVVFLPDNMFLLGRMIYGGEQRYITGQEIVTVPGVGARWRLYLHYAFANSPVGHVTVQLYPGCDKTGATCLARFNNLINFTGMPYMPATDATVKAVS